MYKGNQDNHALSLFTLTTPTLLQSGTVPQGLYI